MKVVLTGGPSCGKTSIINYFKKRGHDTIDEKARRIIEEWNWKNKKLSDREFNKLELEIYNRVLEDESYADARDLSIHFMDRSLIDIDGYCLQRYKKIPRKYQAKPKKYNGEALQKYHKVYILDRLPFINDGTRLENSEEEAQKLHDCIIEAYTRKGYKPIKVPIIPVVDGNINRAIRKRAEYIIADLLGLNTIDKEYEKLQDSYLAVRSKFHFNKSIKNIVENKNPYKDKILRNLLNSDTSW